MTIPTMQMFMDAIDAGGAGGEVDPISAAISSSIAGLEDDAGGEEHVPDPAAAVKPEEADEEKELAALEADIRAKNPAMRGNILIHRHQAVLTRQRNQAEAAQKKAQEEWAAKEQAWQAEKQKYEASVKEWEPYGWAKDPEVEQALRAIALSEHDQRAFAELLLSDPRYSAILQLKDAQAKGDIPNDRPKPNQKSADGSLEYYDDQGLDTLLNWHGSQWEKKLEAKWAEREKALEAKYEEKYGKVADAYERTQVWNEKVAGAKVKLDHMRANWHGFKDHELEMKKLIDANLEARQKGEKIEPITMEEAYRQVVVPKLIAAQKADEAAMRTKLLKEMEEKKAAAGSAVRGGGVEHTDDSAESKDPLGDAIRRSIRSVRE